MKLSKMSARICLVIGTWAVFAGVTLCSSLAAPAADTGFDTLDLKRIVNMDWRDEIWGDGKGGWTDQGDNDLRQIRVGRTQLLGVPFELIDPAGNQGKAVLTLGSKKFLAVRRNASGLSKIAAATFDGRYNRFRAPWRFAM